jgi:cyclopropane fatty-acyl-phospholipid synthase-like methyltransferase
MKRIPEPEVMNGVEQVEAYANADFKDSVALFVQLFKETFPEFNNGVILDIGCGPAHEAIALCQTFHSIKMLCVDASERMISKAKELVTKAKLSHRIDFQICHIPDDPLPINFFDAIVSKDLLHHLLNPISYWLVAQETGKANVPIFSMDLKRPISKYEANKIVNNTNASHSNILINDFFRSFLAAYSEKEVKDQIKECGLTQFHVNTISDRHFIAYGRNITR